MVDSKSLRSFKTLNKLKLSRVGFTLNFEGRSGISTFFIPFENLGDSNSGSIYIFISLYGTYYQNAEIGQKKPINYIFFEKCLVENLITVS